MNRIKLGIVGLGSVAQIIHLPILEALSDRYEVSAICDISRELLDAMGERYAVAGRYTEVGAMLREAELDAVFILNSNEYHAENALEALQAGKHVFIEKPICFTLREAEAIAKARDEAGVQVMVGYMRRFAPAFVQAVSEVKQLEAIRYARIRAIIGTNPMFIDETSRVLYPQDIGEAALQERRQRAKRMTAEAVGDGVPEALYGVYRHMCGLSSHDLSAMRELIGFPRSVLAAAQWNRGHHLTALLEFDGYNAVFETGVDRNRRFDAHLQVYGDTKAITVQYDTPYIRHFPTTLVVEETVNGAFRRSVTSPSLKDPYTYELEAFYETVTKGIPPKTTVEDSMEDLRLFQMIIRKLMEATTA